jgi:hypothetical protein
MAGFETLGQIAGDVEVIAVQDGDGWGIAVRGPVRLSLTQRAPVQAEVWNTDVQRFSAAYATIDRSQAAFTGRTRLPLGDGATLRVEDRWSIEDGLDRAGRPLIDKHFAFASVGGEERDGRLELGLWFPGTEGEVTYLAYTPLTSGEFGGNARRRWRQRYHPIEDGFEQQDPVAFRLGVRECDQAFRRDAWRWAWRTLAPEAMPHDLELVRAALGDMLDHSIQQVGDRAAPAHLMHPVTGNVYDRPAMMGFTGGRSRRARC